METPNNVLNSQNLSVILSSLTVIAAIVAPIFTAWITSRSKLKLRRLEFTIEKTSTCISSFVKGYSELKSTSSLDPYWCFFTAAYSLIAQFPVKELQVKVTQLLTMLRKSNGQPSDETDHLFDEILIDISLYLSSEKPKKRNK